MSLVVRTRHHLRPDPGRLLLRPFLPGAAGFGAGQDRLGDIVRRALDVPEQTALRMLDELRERHQPNFPGLEDTWLDHFAMAATTVDALSTVSDRSRQLLVGALLSQTYACEAAGLTNPSMVPVGEPVEGTQRFVMSARAIGEGHISSIAFLSGSVDAEGNIDFDARHPSISNGVREAPSYSRAAFRAKLEELTLLTPVARMVLGLLPDSFTAAELASAIDKARESDLDPVSVEDTAKRAQWITQSNYQLSFDNSLPVSEHVVSPSAPIEDRGMEDARFVRFTDDDGSQRYYATYTAYDGLHILSQLIETTDFHRFRMATLSGPATHHKGMALFPRKIRGEYLALSRHDQERTFVLRSDDIREWANAELVFGPAREWDLVQTGNCGSPIETDAGWLVITHGVGPMRRYVLGAVLLDLEEPSKVIGRLPGPLVEPEDDERSGYVPDVVYSCGAMAHAGNLILPFGYADNAIKIAVGPIAGLLDTMV